MVCIFITGIFIYKAPHDFWSDRQAGEAKPIGNLWEKKKKGRNLSPHNSVAESYVSHRPCLSLKFKISIFPRETQGHGQSDKGISEFSLHSHPPFSCPTPTAGRSVIGVARRNRKENLRNSSHRRLTRRLLTSRTSPEGQILCICPSTLLRTAHTELQAPAGILRPTSAPGIPPP